MKTIRIDKMLSNLGIASRSEIKKQIKKGKLIVNDKIIKDEGYKVDPDSENIIFDGKKINYSEYVYYVMNKPAGCVTAREDNIHDTVFKYINDQRKNLSPVGRLDLDTEGLLIITDDGNFNHLLMSPAHHVNKTYEAVLDKTISENLIDIFREGINIGDDKLTKPADLQIVNNSDGNVLVRLSISEGRFHQVKRMFEACNRKVIYLKRVSIGNLKLDETLKPGEYRKLTNAEIEGLKQCVK